MSSQISDLLGSDILELTSDGGGKSYFVHKNLLVAQSAFLQTTVNKAADRKIDLHSWDSETVGYLVDFLYLRTYKAREHFSAKGDSPEGTVSDATETQSRVDTPDTTPRGGSPGLGDRRPLTPMPQLMEFHQGEINWTRGETSHSYTVPSTQESNGSQDFLVTHARVYALAQSLGIEALQRMAYLSLLEILAILSPIIAGSSAVDDTVELLRYVYANTTGSREPMRELVSHFAALNFPALQCTDAMKELVGQGGELAMDLVDKVCRRLVASEDELASTQESHTALADVVKEQRARLETAMKSMPRPTEKKQQTTSCAGSPPPPPSASPLKSSHKFGFGSLSVSPIEPIYLGGFGSSAPSPSPVQPMFRGGFGSSATSPSPVQPMFRGGFGSSATSASPVQPMFRGGFGSSAPSPSPVQSNTGLKFGV